LALAHVVGMLPPTPVPVPVLVLDPAPVLVPGPLLVAELVLAATVPVDELIPESIPAAVLVLVPTADPVLVSRAVLELDEPLAATQSPACLIVARNVTHPVSSAAVRAGLHSAASSGVKVMQHAERVAQLVPAVVPPSAESIALPVAHASAPIPNVNAASAPATQTFRSFIFEPFACVARSHGCRVRDH
jgi:hypothetical protein